MNRIKSFVLIMNITSINKMSRYSRHKCEKYHNHVKTKKHYYNVLLVTYCQLQRISHEHMCFYKSHYRFCYTYHVVFMSIIIVLPRIKKEAEVENKYLFHNKITQKVMYMNKREICEEHNLATVGV